MDVVYVSPVLVLGVPLVEGPNHLQEKDPPHSLCVGLQGVETFP